MSDKLSIKFKPRASHVDGTPSEPKKLRPVFLKKSDKSLSSVMCAAPVVMAVGGTKAIVTNKKQNLNMLPVEYVFLDEGEFLYQPATYKLYDVSNEHKYVGFIDSDTLEVHLISP